MEDVAELFRTVTSFHIPKFTYSCNMNNDFHKILTLRMKYTYISVFLSFIYYP